MALARKGCFFWHISVQHRMFLFPVQQFFFLLFLVVVCCFNNPCSAADNSAGLTVANAIISLSFSFFFFCSAFSLLSSMGHRYVPREEQSDN